MRNTLAAGPWRPDLAVHAHDGLVTASGVVVSSNGYKPLKAFEAVTPALADWAGGGAFIGSDGTSALLAGGAANLWRFDGAAWISEIASLTAGNWQFAQFDDLVIGVHGGSPVKYNIVTSAGAALGGTPPNAQYVCVSGNFTVLAGNPADVAKVTWSGFANPEIWTAGTSQSDNQNIPDGGKITGLVGHENYFLVFQRDAINRFTYVGPPLIFQRDKISTGVGCIAPGSIAQVGQLVFFLSERGFMFTDGAEVTPIGYEKIDQTFLGRYPRTELASLRGAVDPRQFLYHVAMPGVPGRDWIYNWREQEWSFADLNLRGVFTGFTSNISLDALDVLYPGGIDTIPVSLDSPIFQGGEPRLYFVDNTGVVGALSGTNMAARFEWPYRETGQRSRVFDTRPITDCTAGMTLTIDAKARLGDDVALTSRGELRASGHMPIRCNGRFLKPAIDIAAGSAWGYFQALELEYGAGGKR